MGIYTLSINYIDGITADKSHLLNVFFKFPNPQSKCKVAIDKSKKILDHYSKNATQNADFFTWLDLMSRNPTGFETIDVVIPDNTLEEEMYLILAAATQPFQKIIVCSHQYWKVYNYDKGFSTITYNGTPVKILDKDEAYEELNPPVETTVIKIKKHTTNMPKNNPWNSGSFYLFLAVIVFALIATISNFVHWTIFPIVLIGGILIIGIIGALQLRNDDKLKEESFLKLMALTYKSLPLLKNNDSKKSTGTDA